MSAKWETSIGYQISHNLFDTTNINNAGDPFSHTTFYQLNSHNEEKDVVNRFAYDVLKCEPNTMWGYCASGSTEAIINGLWMARKRFSHLGIPTVYSSRECHFCVPKAADMLCMPFEQIDTDAHGGMDMDILRDRLKRPAIVVLTLGTTIRNTYDNVKQFHKNIQNLSNVHVHLDAAFGGAVYPFTNPEWLNHPFDTFNVSFHKFWGCPYPCALFLVKTQIKKEVRGNGCFGKEMVCLPDKDFTISCSRNGTAVSLVNKWWVDNKQTKNLLKRCFETKNLFTTLLDKNKVTYRTNPTNGLSVEFFNLPLDTLGTMVREKYSMSVRNVRNGLFDTHIYICGHVTNDTLVEFTNEVLLLNKQAIEHDGNSKGG
jgi:histidine decarboxylase